ncbi:sugar-binding domain-containing protein [Gaetbulibacter sp. M235]|uniref:glycosyl hydrolase 2 galactose-binding domain-containing protein n=1 Tax=Gaetbulibacter sp. M235 TaxID=3126510 RepID=UPI00374F901D
MKRKISFLIAITFIAVSYSQNNISCKVLKNWKIQSSIKIDENNIHTALYDDSSWIETEVPSTVFNALVKNRIYKDIYLGKNLAKISKDIFKASWWYRTTFDIENLNQTHLLELEGINYSANIWLNGKQIANRKEIINSFRQFKLPIDKYLKKSKNVLAIEVFPPKPGDFTLGFVDWNPEPPDNNMGIFRNVNIITNNGVGIENPYVESSFKNENYKMTDLIFSTNLQNYGKDINGVLKIEIGNITINKNVSLKKGENKKIVLSTKNFKQLQISNPKLWWPHTIGKPELYNAKVEFLANNKLVDKKIFDFGIREVSDFFTEDGHRGFKINGKKISIRGGGWVDNIMLDDTDDYIQSQLEYVTDMNLNTIRLEGFWGKNHTIYEKCDKMGILVMVGWSCQWEWESYLGKPVDEVYGGIQSPEDIELMSAAWRDQVVWLRNHPSIFTWMAGSDCKPTPALEKEYFKIFKEYDSTRIYLSSAKEWTSLAGPSGVKMRGPYAYVPPVYWFKDTIYGGAFGFNTETGPGAQVPPLESIKKMIPEKDLWPINDVWDYHCGRNAFNTLERFTEALNNRYGKANNVEDYTFKAQLLNYELMRPMFEAFSANRYDATGVIQWMLNSAWPEMYWQLYDSYLMPNGAYYATKKAGMPIHALYNYNNESIYLVNDKLEDENELKLEIKVLDINSKVIFEKKLNTNAESNSSNTLFKLQEIADLTDTYFLSLKVLNTKDEEIDNNFYWLSKKEDVLDYEAKVPKWNYHTPSKHYSDFTQLENLQKVKLSYEVIKTESEEFTNFEVTLDNPSDKIAFFIELKIVDTETGLSILPVVWSDNYISILPGETRAYKAKIKKKHLSNKETKFVYNGWNANI